MRKTSLLLALCFLASCKNQKPAEPPPAPAPVVVAPPAPPPPKDPVAAAGWSHASVTIDGTLDASMRDAAPGEVSAPLSQVVARILGWWVDVKRELRKGDTVQVVYEVPPGKEPLVHALKFHSTKNEKDYAAYLYQAPGSSFARYYDATGQEVEERLDSGPLDDYEQVTSIPKEARGNGHVHRGVDFKCPVGTPVKLPFDATLAKKTWNFRFNGNCLEFHDAQGRKITFLHLSELSKGLAVGQHVKRGTVVAKTGNTGHSTAPHLHYQLETSAGKLLNPFDVHKTFHASLDPSATGGFSAEREKYDHMLSADAAPAVAAAPAAPSAPAAPAIVPAGGAAAAVPTDVVPAAAAQPAPAPAAAPVQGLPMDAPPPPQP